MRQASGRRQGWIRWELTKWPDLDIVILPPAKFVVFHSTAVAKVAQVFSPFAEIFCTRQPCR